MNNKKAFSVSHINKYLKAVIDEDYALKNIKVIGEISNFRPHYSGHLYFSLKDEESIISCVMFAGDSEGINFDIKNGMSVTISGSVSVFVKSGQYQIYVKAIEREGRGNLFAEFEELKRKLINEGLFDVAHKKPIPQNPRKIAVITSESGAVLRDIISVAKRRNKSIDIIVFPVSVQGEAAPSEICRAIYEVNKIGAGDTVIIGRGGGSAEDLRAFNDETVARAIFESKIPVISAVGHETDFTIADFVADIRAATPSVSAEIAVPLLKDRREILQNAIYYLNDCAQRNFKRREALVNGLILDIANVSEKITEERERNLASICGLVEAVSPLSIISRGYSVTSGTSDEGTVSSVSHVNIGSKITTTLSDGQIVSEVLSKKELNMVKPF